MKGTLVLDPKKELNTGDTVSVIDLATGKTHQNLKIKFVDKVYDGSFDTETGPSIMKPAGNYVVVKLSSVPEKWPPQEDDVWSDGTMERYHFLNGKFHCRHGISWSLDLFKNEVTEGRLTLEYRKN